MRWWAIQQLALLWQHEKSKLSFGKQNSKVTFILLNNYSRLTSVD